MEKKWSDGRIPETKIHIKCDERVQDTAPKQNESNTNVCGAKECMCRQTPAKNN